MSNARLPDGSRVAVVGAGICGSAFGLALLRHARSRGANLELTLFRNPRQPSALPILVGPECRTRLAGLGWRIPPEWRAGELYGVEVICRGQSQVLPTAPSGLWVVDSRRPLARALSTLAVLNGARIVDQQVDRVTPGAAGNGRGCLGDGWTVRARGIAQRFEAVALAAGAASPATSGLGALGRTPTLPAVHAQLVYSRSRPVTWPLARVILFPLPTVDALYLIPFRGSIAALALGAGPGPADLCQALMEAMRDGHLPEGFDLGPIVRTQVPCGAARGLSSDRCVLVGSAAFGHPLQLGLSEHLGSASQAAVALLDCGQSPRRLRARYARDLAPLVDNAVRACRALRWLAHAGVRAPEAFSAEEKSPLALPFAGAVLGLPAPTPTTLLSSARRCAVAESIAQLFRGAARPIPASAVLPEPDLFYVVEDDADARDSLARFLEGKGARTVSFSDELSLFWAVARHPPVAVLLDVVLSWVDGITLCEGLKRHPLTRQVPVFMMSGLARPQIRSRALEVGAEAFLDKPINPHRLLQLLRRHWCEPTPARLPQSEFAGSWEAHA